MPTYTMKLCSGLFSSNPRLDEIYIVWTLAYKEGVDSGYGVGFSICHLKRMGCFGSATSILVETVRE